MGRDEEEDWLDGLDRDGRNEEPAKGRYKLNKKRFAFVLAMFTLVTACCVALVLVVTTAFSNENLPASSQMATVNSPGGTPPEGSAAPASPTPSKAPLSDALKGKSIILDAGHGGSDPGTIGVNGAHEDSLNLKVAQKLKTALEGMGAEILMTRSDSKAIAETKEADMAKRGKIIKDNRTDIAISIHMNSHKTDASVSGPLTLFMTGSEKGKGLAEAIMQELNDALNPEKEGKARSEGNLLILKSGYQPTVIVECGYLSNADEEAKLQQEDYQDQIVEAICKGIQAYFTEPSAT